jgi:hypothetical protein
MWAPGQQLLNAEWLGHVVVGARIERLYLGSFLVPHREHDDGCRHFAAHPAAEFNAAHARHHEIGHDQVRTPFLKQMKSLFRIVGRSYVVPLGGEGGAQYARDLGLIVYHQHSFCHIHLFTTI